jgi:hypothetical protein
MTVYDIYLPGGAHRFAKIFAHRQLERFKKDLIVCLKPGAPKEEERAFMPMLTNVIATLELFSGLYSGHLRGRNEEHLAQYLKAFAPPNRYDDYAIHLLYVAFRHQLAHLGHPCVGFDTSKVSRLKSRPMRLRWSITSDPRDVPIKITSIRPQMIRRWPTPWKVVVDHDIEISIAMLAADLIKTVPKYLAALKGDRGLQDNFRHCMKSFFQR